jgi:hypothetical protein
VRSSSNTSRASFPNSPWNQRSSGTPKPCLPRARIGAAAAAARSPAAPLADVTTELVVERQSRRPFEHVVIEQGRARLERVQHAGAVHLHQHVVGHVGERVHRRQRFHFSQPARRARVKGPRRGPRVVSRRSFPHPCVSSVCSSRGGKCDITSEVRSLIAPAGAAVPPGRKYGHRQPPGRPRPPAGVRRAWQDVPTRALRTSPGGGRVPARRLGARRRREERQRSRVIRAISERWQRWAPWTRRQNGSSRPHTSGAGAPMPPRAHDQLRGVSVPRCSAHRARVRQFR